MKKILDYIALPLVSISFAIFLYVHFISGWMWFYLKNIMETYSYMDIMTILAGAALIYLILVQLVRLKIDHKRLIIAYMIYFIILGVLLFGKASDVQGVSFDTFSFVNSFAAGNLRVITLGNILMFMPIGFLLVKRSFWQTGLIAIGLVTGIEITQYILKVGFFDTGDIFLNTTGILLGFLLLRVSAHLVNRPIKK
ncbi:VanZ family protein [Listeria costaricensis]|uniref:VanZ family protein n=1 Tax=Listeria costaricensis TaxID=2026604 RepID=UPI000C085DC5|nr:VanZ family protein [Listeria costaricensis]